MAEEEPIILPASQAEESGGTDEEPESPRSLRRIILWTALAAAVILVLAIIFLVAQKYWGPRPDPTVVPIVVDPDADGGEAGALPDTGSWDEEPSDPAVPFVSDLAVEYLAFGDFYEAPDNNIDAKPNNYELPLNIKIDVMNYYDVSRKINLDPHLESLNANGFARLDNPWLSANNFSALYAELDKQQIPLLITSDFLIYYYQNVLKKVFKDIEENVFYDNLWEINHELYQAARARYENRLASVGNVNDPVLEAQRLETVFFAVALELLKPTDKQIAPRGAASSQGLFSAAEADKLNFIMPAYLRADVASEVALIRSGRAVAMKSPIFLYNRDYSEFMVPVDYQANAKLNNFYLTTKWLNSVFPLNYASQACPDCLLDRVDWRISLTAAAYLAHDFSSLPELKNKWARIYKIMSFFKGLREDLNYIHYRDALVEIFGEDYEIADLFGADNPESVANLENFRVRLLAYNWLPITGALDRTGEDRTRAGLKMLAESYWPNDYIFSRLTSPALGAYAGAAPAESNISVCNARNNLNRCSGIAWDAINLVYPIGEHAYFSENSNYTGYQRAVSTLRSELDNDIWQLNNYWSTLNLLRSLLSVERNKLPVFAASGDWSDYLLDTAAAGWVNLQLPLHKFSLSASALPDQGLSFSRLPEHFYIDPNINLINEILSHTKMLLGMFSALQLDTEVRPAVTELRNFHDRLAAVREVALKELRGETLGEEDNALLAGFIREFKVSPIRPADQKLNLKMSGNNYLRLDLSRFKLLALIHRDGDNQVLAVGPVWDYQESR